MRNLPCFLPGASALFALAALSLSGMAPAVSAEEEKSAPELPAVLQDGNHERGELGVNEFTAPSIRKIFENLQDLPAIPQDQLNRPRPEKLPMDRGELAMELGFLMADGFVIVQVGKLSEVRPLAQELSRYAKALGAGERVNRHAASLLKHAEEGNIESLKNELALTQRDVESELISLRDPDLSHFIGLGGWIRALDAATAALKAEFSPEKAMLIFQPDIPEYFDEALAGLDPLMLKRKDVAGIRKLLKRLQQEMTLKEGEKPTSAQLDSLIKTTRELSTLALARSTGK